MRVSTIPLRAFSGLPGSRSRRLRAGAGPLWAAVSVAWLLCAPGAGADPAQEAALLSLWARHAADPDDHAGLAAACESFVERYEGAPLTLLARGLQGWHLLKAGQPEAAAQVLERVLEEAGDGPAEGAAGAQLLRAAAADVARSWLTRMDREQVKQALRAYYLRQIAYPESLDAVWSLPEARGGPATDRWGHAWSYRPVGFQGLVGLRGQRYELRSPILGPDSDLQRALARPYGADMAIEPAGTGVGPDRETVRFTRKRADGGRTDLFLRVGTTGDGILFCYRGPRILVLSDRTYWKVFPARD